MRVHVLFFGVLKDVVGKTGESLDLPAGATVSDVLVRYGKTSRMAELLPSVAVSVNQEYALRDAPLRENDEIALLPPVSGGATRTQTETASDRVRTRLVRDRIDTQPVIAAIKQPSDGAIAVFEGVVREQSRGRQTMYLDYEAYEAMAAKELEKLACEALTRFAVRDVTVVHRLGRLEIGETSVLIVVAAAHRGPAFDACRWLIDTLKRVVPVWKKEKFSDGAVWADGEPFPPTQDMCGTQEKR